MLIYLISNFLLQRSDCPDKIKQHIAEEHPESQISLPCTQETLPPPVESPPRMTIDNPSIIRSSSPSTHSTPRSRHRSQLDMEDVSPIAATPVTSGVHANIPRRLVTELFSSEALVDAQDTDSPKDKSSPPLLDCYSSSSEAVVESMKRRRLSTSSSSDVPRVSKRKKTIASSSSSSSPLSSASSSSKKRTVQRPLTRSQRRSTQKREFKCDICRKVKQKPVDFFFFIFKSNFLLICNYLEMHFSEIVGCSFEDSRGVG